MANITEFFEDFDGGASGAEITSANSKFTNITGTGPNATFQTTSAYTTTNGMFLSTTANNRIYRADCANRAQIWLGFYIRFKSWPTTATAFINSYQDTTKIADVRVHPDGTIQLRSVNTDRWTSTPLSLNTWYRIGFLTQPGSGSGVLRLKIFGGANLDSTTASQDSNTQVASAVATAVNNLRIGVISNETMSMDIDRIRADDANENAPAPASNTAPTANAGPDQSNVSPYSTVTLDGSGSTDPEGQALNYNWVQVSGKTVTLSGTGATRTYVHPASLAGETLVFGLTVTDSLGASSTQDTVTVQGKAHNYAVVAPNGVDRISVRPYVKS